MKRRWLALVVGVMAGIACLFAGHQRYVAEGPLAQSRNVVLPHGTPAELAVVLRNAEVIESIREFEIAALLTRGAGSLHAAELTFPAHASLRQVLMILRTGRPVQHRLTIPEGLTAAQIALLIDRADALSGDAAVPEEGSVLPQTYAYDYGMTRSAFIEHAQAAMQKTVERIWGERSAGLPLASPADLVTLASIVERETARPEERPHVAAVYLNRLRNGMKLQADPTVAYAASGGMGSLDHPITRAELDSSNPYNTYRFAGLPPGPIASPGLASLQAVARPIASDDLYFVADGTGGHLFARTLDEHNRNVRDRKPKTGTL